jgi:predicted RNA methylase
MNKALFTIYRIIVPKPFRTIIRKKSLRIKILKYFNSLPAEEINDEQREVLRYLENNPLSTFPYPFQYQYSPEKIEVFFDAGNKMHYVFLDGKRLYFKKRWSKKRIRKGFSDLLREQDMKSPHRYLTGNFNVNNDIIADIGAAEGNFSLSVIEKVKKLFIFEYDHEWSQALRATFAPWSEKVEIINKRVADFDDEKHISFDTFYKTRPEINFLKIDVDGAEANVLRSCHGILSPGKPVRIVLCTYHRDNDEEDFTSLLQNYGFKVSCSKGYMIHYFDKQMIAPYLRRGLIRAIRS